MKKSFIVLLMATSLLASCDKKSDKTDERTEGYTPEKVTLSSDVMTPEMLNSMGRVGGVSLSPDKKTTESLYALQTQRKMKAECNGVRMERRLVLSKTDSFGK